MQNTKRTEKAARARALDVCERYSCEKDLLPGKQQELYLCFLLGTLTQRVRARAERDFWPDGRANLPQSGYGRVADHSPTGKPD